MAPKIDPQVVAKIIATVAAHAEGATLKDVIAAFTEPETLSPRTAHRWLQALAWATAAIIVVLNVKYLSDWSGLTALITGK